MALAMYQIRHAYSNHGDIHAILCAASPYVNRDCDYLISVSDVTGENIAIGSAVTKAVVGDRAIATVNPNWLTVAVPSLLHIQETAFGGCLVQYWSHCGNDLKRISDSLSPDETCTLPIPGMAVQDMLFNALYKLKAGDLLVWLGTDGFSM
ncbi:hypothetical protein BD626DRAFT_575213 [Schizophyllum amplum]|uniref:Uncharacterized protein n=1 Tax=Schizophyllum amplum TaxID=97359 RepID=A0A550BW38_9AGAR|nr:hypothetical protein BD626DRAFT_575213 [Auriculariopsis ampla]